MIYAVFLLITFIILVVTFYQWQYFMIFSPVYYREDELDEQYEMLSVITHDKVELEGVVFTPLEKHYTLLFFGGRSHDSVGLIKRLALNFPHAQIITFNYRSYGKSGGKLSEKKIFRDALLVTRKVKEHYGECYVLGYSLGSSVASYVASKENLKGLFLVGVYDSIAGIAKKKFGFDASKFFRYKFDNTKFVTHIDADTYIFASKSDNTTYIENSRRLSKYVKNLKYYKELENLHHKDVLWSKEVIGKINEVMDNE